MRTPNDSATEQQELKVPLPINLVLLPISLHSYNYPYSGVQAEVGEISAGQQPENPGYVP